MQIKRVQTVMTYDQWKAEYKKESGSHLWMPYQPVSSGL